MRKLCGKTWSVPYYFSLLFLFELASRNAMQNASAAAQLNLTRPPLTFQEMQRLNEGKYAGDALYKKIIGDAANDATVLRTVNDPIGCFVAGTQIHTKDGLKPIEQIQMGDWVLSKPESGEGEVAYKRVVNTFSFADKEIWSVDFIVGDDLDNGLEGLIVTGNHPFWVKGEGWTRVDHLYQGARLELPDGREAVIFSIKPVYKTSIEGIGYIHDGLGSGARDIEEGASVDLRCGFLQRDYGTPRIYQPFYSGEGIRFGSRVYNFEVEDCHTYYAGRFGIWVHNSTSCVGEGTVNKVRTGNNRGQTELTRLSRTV